jgi:hypothetical protein
VETDPSDQQEITDDNQETSDEDTSIDEREENSNDAVDLILSSSSRHANSLKIRFVAETGPTAISKLETARDVEPNGVYRSRG